MSKNYYTILGITDEDIKLSDEEFIKVVKKKYRKIALTCHPDRQRGKSEAEKKAAEKLFKEATEAKEKILLNINERTNFLKREKERSNSSSKNNNAEHSSKDEFYYKKGYSWHYSKDEHSSNTEHSSKDENKSKNEYSERTTRNEHSEQAKKDKSKAEHTTRSEHSEQAKKDESKSEHTTNTEHNKKSEWKPQHYDNYDSKKENKYYKLYTFINEQNKPQVCIMEKSVHLFREKWRKVTNAVELKSPFICSDENEEAFDKIRTEYASSKKEYNCIFCGQSWDLN